MDLSLHVWVAVCLCCLFMSVSLAVLPLWPHDVVLSAGT